MPTIFERLNLDDPRVDIYAAGLMLRYPTVGKLLRRRLSSMWALLVGVSGHLEVETPLDAAREVQRQLAELAQGAGQKDPPAERPMMELPIDEAKARWHWVEDGPVQRLMLDGYQLAWAVVLGNRFLFGCCEEFANEFSTMPGRGGVEQARAVVEQDIEGEWYGGGTKTNGGADEGEEEDS